MKIFSSFSLIALLILTTGCANTTKEVSSNKLGEDAKENAEYSSAKQETYEASGKTYYTKEGSFKQRGQASWYGQAFHGRRTATGEKFNMYQMTAAHNSIPLPAYVRVKNLDNGKSLVVRVNDHMPKHRTRIIDVSYAAAKELGLHRAGLANVEIERVYLKEDK
jgi:rare lipoprotein A